MRRIVCPSRAGSSSRGPFTLVLLLGVLMLAATSAASLRPRYGGALRVQIRERVKNIDPLQWPADSLEATAAEVVASLVLDRLVRFNPQGVLQGALAVSWESGLGAKRWQFHLRQGVKFTDGASMTPETVVLAMQQLLGNSFDVSATSNSVVIAPDQAMPNLPAQLAAGRELSRAGPLVLDYDSGDTESRDVSERVAVNLQGAGIAVRISGRTAGNKANSPVADFRLARQHIGTPDPGAALESLLAWAGEPAAAADMPEQFDAAERAPIDDFRVIPLAHVSEAYGLGPQVRNWMAPRWGGWRLDDVWLAPVAAAGGTPP